MPSKPGNRLLLKYIRLRNALDYPLRQFFRWRRNGCGIQNEDKTSLFAELDEPLHQAAREVAVRLAEKYDLDGLYRRSTRRNYRENLFYLHLLDNVFTAAFGEDQDPLPDTLLAADVGVSHWFYVQALHAFLRRRRDGGARRLTLEGYEADAYRIYADFHSRADHAGAHMLGLQDTTFLPHGFTSPPGRYDLITLFFPFVFLTDHLEWGLPQGAFHPANLLEKAWSALKSGGVLLIVNQGEEEHQAQARLLETAGIPFFYRCPFVSPVFSYELERYAILAVRR